MREIFITVIVIAYILQVADASDRPVGNGVQMLYIVAYQVVRTSLCCLLPQEREILTKRLLM